MKILGQSIVRQLGDAIKPTVLLASSVCLPNYALAVPLTFDQIVNSTAGSNLLGATATEQTIYFKDVATDNGTTVDAKVTTSIKGDTDFADQTSPKARNYFGDAGYIPDYLNGASGPQDDLGFLYYGNGVDSVEDGITMTFEFFEGTGLMSGTFVDTVEISALEIAIYDVDGEASQSEYFTAQKADGLVSFATGTTAQALSVTDFGDSLLFEGPGQNYSETDATGAAILYYELTESLSLDFGSVQTSGPSQNAVFSAIDGDLSLFQDTEFGEIVTVTPVPLPMSGLLLLTSLVGFCSIARSRSV